MLTKVKVARLLLNVLGKKEHYFHLIITKLKIAITTVEFLIVFYLILNKSTFISFNIFNVVNFIIYFLNILANDYR